MSLKHARSVALVLNPRTGLVSAQWHVKCDNKFETINPVTVDPSHGHWERMAGLIKVLGQAGPSKLGRILGRRQQPTTLTPLVNDNRHFDRPVRSPVMPTTEGVDSLEAFPSEGAEINNFEELEFDDFDGGNDVNIGTPRVDSIQDTSGYHPTQKYLESLQTKDVVLPVAYTMGNDMYDHDSDEMPAELDDPIAFLAATAKGDPDNMNYHQAMKQPDSLQFK
jgi:hypothetical protein